MDEHVRYCDMKPHETSKEFFVDSTIFLKYQVHLILIVSDSSSTLIDDLGAKIPKTLFSGG